MKKKKKKIKQQYGCEYYKNLSKDEKKKFIECYKMRKKYIFITIRNICYKNID